MQVVVLGLNQTSAPLAIRERVAFDPARLAPALERLAGEAAECFILSTCNRVELYAVAGHEATGRRGLAGFLAAYHGVAPDTLAPCLYSHAHADAAHHFFGVASGLDSMVLGEDQIMAQVKAALEAADAAGTLGPLLHRFGSSALAVAKQVRSGTAIGRSATSVVSVALDAASEHLGDLGSRRILVIGAGRTAQTVCRHLARLAACVTVVNRTEARGAMLGAQHGMRSAPWSRLHVLMAEADVIVSATGAPCVVINADELARARANRAPLVCLDLAVPRDIDPRASGLPGVTIYDMDRLRHIADENRRRREAEIAPAKAIVADGVARYMEWWRARQVVPSITRLRARADAVRAAELARALDRMPALAAREREIVGEMAARIVNKLLHHPVAALKHDPEAANMAFALERLFELPEQPSLEDAMPAGSRRQ